MISVLIAEVHPALRKALAQIASESREIEVRGEASDCASLMKLMKDESCGVLVLDAAMPGEGGADVATIVRGRHPETQVLLLSMYSEDQYAIRALKAGAAGYITKDSAPERLVDAILSVSRGKTYIGPGVAETLGTHPATVTEGTPPESHSEAELQVMRLIGSAGKARP